MRLDKGTVSYFKTLATELGMPYQNLINLYLRDCALHCITRNLRFSGLDEHLLIKFLLIFNYIPPRLVVVEDLNFIRIKPIVHVSPELRHIGFLFCLTS